MWIRFVWLRIRTEEGSGVHGSEHSGVTNGGKYTKKLSYYYHHTKDA
jgi:hypothetical protein